MAVTDGNLYAATVRIKGGVRELEVHAIEVDGTKSARSVVLDRVAGDAGLLSFALSPDARLLLCSVIDRYPSYDRAPRAWVGTGRERVFILNARDLTIVSQRDFEYEQVSPGIGLRGFASDGNILLLQSGGSKLGVNTTAQVTEIELDAHALGREVVHRIIQFDPPVWRGVFRGPNGTFWAVEAKRSPRENEIVSAYEGGAGAAKLVASREIPMPANRNLVLPKGYSAGLPGLDPPGGDGRYQPIISGILAIKGGALVALRQPAFELNPWTRVLRLGLNSGEIKSSDVPGCDLNLGSLGAHGRIAFGQCRLDHQTGADHYRTTVLKEIFVSALTGSILAIEPLNRKPTWLGNVQSPAVAVDDATTPAVAAIYDHQGEVRFISIPQ